MLNDAEFEHWCAELNLPQSTRDVVAQIRKSEPLRRVGGGGSNNVCGRYPSVKMGKTIQFESHKVELPAIEFYEANEDIQEYYDQPFQLELSFTSTTGRRIRCKHIPDFLILHKLGPIFEEWKTESRLQLAIEKQPNHYCQDIHGKWHNPPAEKAAGKYGIQYTLRLDKEINWTEYRNNQFLKSYRTGYYKVNDATEKLIVKQVEEIPGLTIDTLLAYIPNSSPDDIYSLISSGQVYIDKQQHPLTKPDKVQLFRDKETATAYALISHQNKTEQHHQALSLNSKPLENALQQASPEDLKIANYRYRIIQAYLSDNSTLPTEVSLRTVQRWTHNFKKSQHLHGWGYIGLLPHHAAKGNRTAKISDTTRQFMNEIADMHYSTFQQKGAMAVYGILQREWDKSERGGPCPSHVTFYQHLHRQNQYQQTKKRQGRRAAYQQSSFHWELSLTTPRHGDRPFELCHIDHTELDIELVCSRTGQNLGRPWATVLLDAFSRRVLSLYLSFEPPSYRACMMALRICVQRFERFPDTLVMDHGAEFNSIYFETLLATFHCTKKQRPSARPRFGSIMERFFGTANTELLYTLQGNTQSTKNVRQLTRHNNPKTLAVWTLEQLYSAFCQFAYEVYDQLPHPALGQSPREAFLMGVTQTGLRPQQRIINDLTFHILTLPSTAKGTAKVHPGRGIRVNYLNYWAIDDSFLNPTVEGTSVPVRYDPFDVSTAYAYVKGRWVRCISEHQALFQGRSQKEIRAISAELRREKQLHSHNLPLRTKTIASYLESTETTEALQIQRLKDLAAGDVHHQLQPHFSPSTDPVNEQQSPDTIEIDLTQIKPYRNEELWT